MSDKVSILVTKNKYLEYFFFLLVNKKQGHFF